MDHYNTQHTQQQQQRPSFGPQPTPHQHPHATPAPHSQQSSLVDHHQRPHSRSYTSSFSASDWDIRVNFIFSDSGLGAVGGSGLGSGSGVYSKPKSVDSLSCREDGGEGKSGCEGGARDVYSPEHHSSSTGCSSFSSTPAAPSFNSSSCYTAAHQHDNYHDSASRRVYEAYGFELAPSSSSQSQGRRHSDGRSSGRFQERSTASISAAHQSQSLEFAASARRNSASYVDFDPRPPSSLMESASTYSAFAADPFGLVGIMGPPPRLSHSRFSSNSGLVAPNSGAGQSSTLLPCSLPHPPRKNDVIDHSASANIIDTIAENGLQGLMTDASRKGFNRLLLEHCDDFVHVLSLKGSLLYVSPSVKRMLGYDPSELIGKALISICHPSDIVYVLRELKETGRNTPINIVYRVRRKTSGYVWLEATGKLHLEQGKGRKCVIFVGRPREVYRMSWSDLERLGGCGTTEYWSKLTINRVYLYATRAVETVLGVEGEEMTGKTVAQLNPGGDATEVLEALQQASKGVATSVRHQMLAKSKVVDVVTHFYPARSETDISASPLLPTNGTDALTVIAQTSLFSYELTKARNVSLPSAPFSRSFASSLKTFIAQSPSSVPFIVPSSTLESSESDDEGESSSRGYSGATSFSAIQSTFKQLTPSVSVSDNVFDELDSARGTSWQFELYQMRLTNKKLREEKEALLAVQRKKRKRAANTDELVVPGGGSASGRGKNARRQCANCGCARSVEWRTGPTGPRTLCNPCGLRWSKFALNSLLPT